MAPTIPSRGGPGALKHQGRRVQTATAGKSIAKKTRGTKRYRKIAKDTIRGITKPDIRRLARRGGVKRISVHIYDDIRQALKARLELILRDCIAYTEYRNAKTITINDVIFALRRIGKPIYGFDPDSYNPRRKIADAGA